MPVWLTGLHSSVRHTKGQGLVLWGLQKSLWSPWLGLKRAFFLGEGDLLVIWGAGGAGVHVPRRVVGLGGTLSTVVGTTAHIHDAGDVDLGPVATRRL